MRLKYQYIRRSPYYAIHLQARACCGLISYVLVSKLSCRVRAVMYLSCLELRFSYVQITNLTGQFPGTNGGIGATWSQKRIIFSEQRQEILISVPLEERIIEPRLTRTGVRTLYIRYRTVSLNTHSIDRLINHIFSIQSANLKESTASSGCLFLTLANQCCQNSLIQVASWTT